MPIATQSARELTLKLRGVRTGFFPPYCCGSSSVAWLSSLSSGSAPLLRNLLTARAKYTGIQLSNLHSRLRDSMFIRARTGCELLCFMKFVACTCGCPTVGAIQPLSVPLWECNDCEPLYRTTMACCRTMPIFLACVHKFQSIISHSLGSLLGSFRPLRHNWNNGPVHAIGRLLVCCPGCCSR